MNILILYNSTQTYTNTVYEHVASFGDYSKYNFFYTHADSNSLLNVDIKKFDSIGIHYSVRLPFDQISNSVEEVLSNFNGLKFLFIQDEYDYTYRSWHWINKLGINLVFTVVPQLGIETVYPKDKFPNSRFVTNLTGYVPEKLPSIENLLSPSKRNLFVGYRGRPLPIRYGQLGFDKVSIAKQFKYYCNKYNLNCDIEWSEEQRIYGQDWYQFISSCRAMLGSESGSNVFDWKGDLGIKIENYLKSNPNSNEKEIYNNLILNKEIDGLMNQISPKIFEAVAFKTVLVLYEGTYSSILKPGVHYIPIKKDFSNIDKVLEVLKNDGYVDEMADRAWDDLIGSQKYSYRSFVEFFDKEIELSISELEIRKNLSNNNYYITLSYITTNPIRSNLPQPSTDTIINTFTGAKGVKNLIRRILDYIWWKLPTEVRDFLKPLLKPIFRKG